MFIKLCPKQQNPQLLSVKSVKHLCQNDRSTSLAVHVVQDFIQKCINQLDKTSQLKPLYNNCLCTSRAAATLSFLSLTDKDFSDSFHDPKSSLLSADDLNRLLSNVLNHFGHDLDDVDNMF